ncbi:GntR family transcriptional regulator [Rhodococcus sp. IEGM 1379]|uniref:GntR family transcriptional regulator n=1 Tax=Rhodococcus sp. IEGM 1379 TaxID=3047086 RepID=UPI0024B8111F|nr:GntR family transcriptional regulator [Rhodococcus sp. IEGM 1379]MDI9913927.1 GntR family transcriptional regulator [Rhodococcus sp. IEGM 1379]
MAAPARSRAANPVLRRRPQLSEDVANHVRNVIMSGGVRPGDFIRLDETAAELGVSVTPVREALVALRGEGMVELVPHRGYVVCPLSRQDIEDIFWLQGEIAVKLALRATASITAEHLAELVQLNSALREALERSDATAIEQCEFEFHRLINRVAGGAKLGWFLFGAIRYTPARLYATDPGWGELAVKSHVKLIEAFEKRDLGQVGRQMRVQFSDGAERLLAHLDKIGIWD